MTSEGPEGSDGILYRLTSPQCNDVTEEQIQAEVAPLELLARLQRGRCDILTNNKQEDLLLLKESHGW